MAKMTTYAAILCGVAFAAFFSWRLWEGYRTGWVTIPSQLLYQIDFAPRSPGEMRDWVATFAIQQGFRRVETGVPAEFQAIKDGGGITWRYPSPNSVSSDLHGGIEIWNGGDPKEFRDMVALMDRQISKLGRVVRIVLVVDPRTHNCGDACRVELAHPVDLSRFEELVQPRR